MLKLKLQYFGHLMWRTDLLEKTWCRGRLRAGGGGGNRGWDGWMASLTQRAWVWANPRRWWRTGKPGILFSPWGTELDTTEGLKNKEDKSIKSRNEVVWGVILKEDYSPHSFEGRKCISPLRGGRRNIYPSATFPLIVNDSSHKVLMPLNLEFAQISQGQAWN